MNIRKVIEKFVSVASWAGVMATIIAIVSYYGVYQKDISEKMIYEAMSQRDISNRLESVIKDSQSRIDEIKIEVAELSKNRVNDIDKIKDQLQRLLLLASTQNLDSKSQQELISLVTERVASKLSENTDINELTNRIKIIEDVVVQNPEKALQIPFIKQEVSGISKSVEKIQETLKSLDDSLDEIKVYKSQVDSLTNQVNNTNNWMIGIFGALGVSVLGLLIGNVFKQRREQA